MAVLRPDTGYKDIVGLLVGARAGAAPVIGTDGRVLGLVTEADLLHKAEFSGAGPGLLDRRRCRQAQAKASARTAAELMSTPAITTRPGVRISDAAALMESADLDLLAVVGEDGRFIGTVSRVDVLRVYLVSDEALRDEILDQVVRGVFGDELHEVRVEVERGIVTLSGPVDRRSTADLLVQLVETVAGVVDVTDRLGCARDDLVDLWCRRVAS